MDEQLDALATHDGDELLAGGGARIGGRYEILALLGAGGMGRVYRARDLELDEHVALKVLHAVAATDRAAQATLERFRLEVKLARRVTHRNVARTFDLGEHEGTRFLTMELIDGPSLADIAESDGPQSAERVIAWARDVCAGLAAAHAVGVIHRDLKPQNVLVERASARVVLTDFGVACATAGAGSDAGGFIAGTPAYMAPEQLVGDELDVRADLWALGATMFRMLTGEPVRGAVRVIDALADPERYRSDARAVRSSVPEALARVVERCLAARRDDRYADATAVAADLERAAARADAAPTVTARGTAPAGGRATSSARAASTPSSSRRVAVLPFENGGDASDAHFADGLAEELTDLLSMMPELRVSARGAVRATKPDARDPRDVGRDLGVDVVVTGSVRRAGEGVRVMLRLVGVADGFQIWARRLDGEIGDLLRIASRAADALGAALATHSDEGATAAMAARTGDGLAIDLFFRGKQEYRRFWGSDAARAVGLFESALERAPDDPVILAFYAMACARQRFHGHDVGPGAERAAERALAIAPQIGEPHVAMAQIHAGQRRQADAAAELARAVAIAPLLVDARETLGILLVECGATQIGCDMLQTALALEPENHYPHVSVGRAHALVGRWDAANEAFARATSTSMAPLAWLMRARVALWRRDASEVAELRRVAPPPTDVMALGHAFLAMLDGHPFHAMAVGVLEGIVAASAGGDPRRGVLARQILAETAAFAGDTASAIEHVERACADGLYDAAWLERCPLLTEARESPALARVRGEVLGRARRIIESAEGR